MAKCPLAVPVLVELSRKSFSSTNLGEIEYLFNVISVQFGTHRSNLVTIRNEELPVLNHITNF